jgi:hypothetical protein
MKVDDDGWFGGGRVRVARAGGAGGRRMSRDR